MTTATIPASSGRPGRVFLANFLGGPIIAAALMTAPVWAAVAISATADQGANGKGLLAVVGFWLLTALFLSLAYLSAGLASGVYAWLSTRTKGGYSVPLAIGISVLTALVLATGAALSVNAANNKPSLMVAVVGAAISAAAAGFLARRAGAAWR